MLVEYDFAIIRVHCLLRLVVGAVDFDSFILAGILDVGVAPLLLRAVPLELDLEVLGDFSGLDSRIDGCDEGS